MKVEEKHILLDFWVSHNNANMYNQGKIPYNIKYFLILKCFYAY